MGDAREPRGGSGLAHFLVRLWREKPLGTAGGVVVLGLILVAIFADVLAPTRSMKCTSETCSSRRRPST